MEWLVDYSSIERNIVEGTYRPHQAFLPKGFLGAIDERPYKFDPAKAKDLLAKAGLPNGFSVTMDVRKIPRLLPTSRRRSRPNLAQAGIKLELIPGDGKADTDKVSRPHARHLHRPVGPGLSRSSLQCRDVRDQRKQRRGRQVEDARLAQRVGHSRR